MTLEQIIQLGNMGYTKEDIAALQADNATPAQTVQQPSQTPAEQPAPAQQQQSVDFLEALKLLGQQMQQPVQQPVPAQQLVQQPAPAQQQPVQQPGTVQQQTVQQPSINLSAEDLVKLTQGIAVQTAAGSIETPRSANDIILSMLDAYESTVKKED